MRKRRILAVLLAVGGLFGTLLALDVYLLLRSAQVEALVRSQLAKAFDRPFRLREVHVSLIHGVRIRGLEVLGAEDEPELRVEEASVSVDWRRLALREIHVLHPEIRVVCRKDGTFSTATLFRPEIFERREPAPELPSLAIRIEGARLHFSDRSHLPQAPHELPLSNINVDIAVDAERGIEAHGSIALPFAKSFTFAASATPQEGVFDLMLEGQKIRVGPELRPLVPPAPRKIFDLLRPEGVGDIEMHVSNRGRPKIAFWGEVKAHEGSVSPLPFPYRTYNSSGTVRIDNNHIMLRGVHGGQKGGTYGCDGDIYAMPAGEDDRIDLRIWEKNMPVDDDLIAAVPKEVGAIIRRFSPSGRGDATIHVYGNSKPPGVPDDMHWDIAADYREGAARFDLVPIPVHGLAGRVEVHDTRFVMQKLTGTAAEGRVEITGYASQEQVDVKLHGTGIMASPALREHLPESGRAPFDAVSPEGPLEVTVAVRGERDAKGEMEPTFEARLSPLPGLSVHWDEFPLPLEAREGEVVITPDGGRIARFVAGRGPLTVTVTGEVGSTDRGLPVALDIDVADIALDDAVRRALRGAGKDLVEKAGLEAGRVLAARVEARKAAFQSAVVISGTAELAAIRARPPKLPYLIEDVRASVAFTKDSVEVRELAGRAGAGTIAGGGVISLVSTAGSTAGATVRGIVVDRALREALEAAGLAIFDRVDVAEGRVDVAVALRGGGVAIAPAVELRLHEAAMTLSLFPFPLARVEADFAYADGRVGLDWLTGLLGEALVEAHGEVAPLGPVARGRPPVAKLFVRVKNLALDKRVRDALPEALRRVYASADLAGRATIETNVLYDGRVAGAPILFNGQAALSGVRADMGIILKDVKGRVPFVGATPRDAPERTTIAGGLALDEAHWQSQVATDVSGFFRVGGGLFELREMRGRFLGGLLRGGLYAFYDSPLLYGGEFRLIAGRVEQWSAKASGRADARLAIAGAVAEPGRKEKFRGEGRLSIGHADLWKLPTVASLLAVLSFEAPRDAVFDDAEFDMRLDGNRMIIDRAEMSSPAISFLGRGEMVDGKLNVHLTHELGRPWLGELPVIGDLWSFLKGNIVEVEVGGTLDEPEIKVIPVKAVTDPMRWLFGGHGEDAPHSKKRMEE